MLEVLIDKHPAGYSTIVDAKLNKRAKSFSKDGKPSCYCHGPNKEEANEVNQNNAYDMDCEWGYLFDDFNIMSIYAPIIMEPKPIWVPCANLYLDTVSPHEPLADFMKKQDQKDPIKNLNWILARNYIIVPDSEYELGIDH